MGFFLAAMILSGCRLFRDTRVTVTSVIFLLIQLYQFSLLCRCMQRGLLEVVLFLLRLLLLSTTYCHSTFNLLSTMVLFLMTIRLLGSSASHTRFLVHTPSSCHKCYFIDGWLPKMKSWDSYMPRLGDGLHQQVTLWSLVQSFIHTQIPAIFNFGSPLTIFLMWIKLLLLNVGLRISVSPLLNYDVPSYLHVPNQLSSDRWVT